MTLWHDRVSYYCGSYHYGDGKAEANWEEQDLIQGNQKEAAAIIQARKIMRDWLRSVRVVMEKKE